MRLTYALTALPFAGILVGIFFANRVEPYVLGLPFVMFWLVAWVVLTAAIMAVGMTDATVTTLTKALVPVVALGAVAFVFAGGQTIVTLLLLGYALVTQLFPSLVLSLARPRWVNRYGAMAGIVAGVGMVAAMSFTGATPETASTVDSFIGGLPSFLAQMNLAILALAVNLVVTLGVSAATRGTAVVSPPSGRFDRVTATADTSRTRA